MKRVITILFAMLVFASLNGQHLITGPRDFVVTGNSPYNPMLIQDGPAHLYWTGAVFRNSVEHPMLPGLTDIDTDKAHFIRYDKYGKAVSSTHIRGSYNIRDAFTGADGLYIFGQSNSDVDADGTPVPIGNASSQEYLISYDRGLVLKNIEGVWNLDQSQYPNSIVAFEERSGSIYLAGRASYPMRLAKWGMIGEGYDDYFYLLKFNRDLTLMNVYFAGFDQSGGEWGSYDDLLIVPHFNGSVLLTGIYEGDRSPIIGGQTLTSTAGSYGIFAVLLDPGLDPIWVRQGTAGPSNNYTHQGFRKGFPMKDGGFVLGGESTKGEFVLEGKAIIQGWESFDERNLFACRMTPDGMLDWVRPLHTMEVHYEGKKSTNSDSYSTGIEFDFLSWRDKILYVCGEFQNPEFMIAGRNMNKPLVYGAFVAAVDMENGEEIWGYSLSSDNLALYGFDSDAAGSLSLMGRTGPNQEFEGIGPTNVPGKNPVFMLGLDVGGNAVWYNNSYLQDIGFGLTGADLEVLPGGEVFVSMYKSSASSLYIGGSDLFVDFNYSNWMVGLVANNSLRGNVLDTEGNPVTGKVKLFKSSSRGRGAYPAVDSVNTDATGHYVFNGIYPGNYTLLAIPEESSSPDGLPCYYGSKVAWTDAWFMDVQVNKEETEVDIQIIVVPELTEQDGSGEISGTITYEEEGAGKKLTDAKPVIRSTVILKKKSSAAQKSTHAGDDDIVAYGETDESGTYTFNNVPNGDYLLIVDITGLDMIETHEVTISDNQLNYVAKDYTVSDEGIYTYTGVGITLPESLPARIWPNPGNGSLNIDFPSSEYELEIFNLAGQKVLSQRREKEPGIASLDISHLQSGMYLLRFSSPEGQAYIKYLKH